MHCRSCEILLEEELKNIEGIKKTRLNFKTGKGQIWHSKEKLDLAQIQTILQKNGYDLGENGQKTFFSSNPQDYKDLFLSIIILGILYLVIRYTGLKSFKTGSLTNPSSLSIVLLIGLTAGFSTCMTLVGGLILGISARFSEMHPGASPLQKFRPHIFFNLGRIISFIVLGGLIGWFGSFLELSGKSLGIISIFIGLIMLLIGLQLIKIFPFFSRFQLTLPKGIAKLFGINRRENEYSHLNSAIVGAITFFLPCGFTQAMQIYAISTGKPISGALVMGLFALGTTPGLLGIGGLTSIIKGSFAGWFFKFAGLAVIIFALINITNGYNLTGFKLFSFSKNNFTVNDPNVKIKNGVQEVNMKQTSRGYSPNKFTIQNNIPVKWIIQSEDPNSCAASIYSADLNVKKYLNQGQNEIDFTPKNTGTIKFSCSMGMYRGSFNVIDKNQNLSDIPVNANQITDNNSCPGSCKSKTILKDAPSQKAQAGNNTQIIKATYTISGDIQPNKFEVKVGIPVRFEIDVKESGQGCMGTIMIPGLVDTPKNLIAGQNIIFEFTPTTKTKYLITCAHRAIRGEINVI